MFSHQITIEELRWKYNNGKLSGRTHLRLKPTYYGIPIDFIFCEKPREVIYIDSLFGSIVARFNKEAIIDN